MNAKECAPELRRRHVIAESTETDIQRARDARTARGILYDHLHRHCTLEQIVVLSRVLTEVDSGLGRTKGVGQRLYARITRVDASGTDQKVGPVADGSQLHLSPPKTPANAGNNYIYAELLYASNISEMSACSVIWDFRCN